MSILANSRTAGEQLVADWITPGASVLDLGCGDGQLLASLTKHHSITACGVERHPDAVIACISAGVAVIQADIERGLPLFADQSFDFVVLLQTLQELNNPAEAIQEMLRIGKQAIVTFANDGHWRRRLAMLRGRIGSDADVSSGPLKRIVTADDFEKLCATHGLQIVKRTLLNQLDGSLASSSLRADFAAYMLKSA